MTTAELLEHLREEAMKLPETERRELVLSLQDSLSDVDDDDDDDDDFALHPAWDDEIARRIQRIKNGTARLTPAAEAIAEIRTRFGW